MVKGGGSGADRRPAARCRRRSGSPLSGLLGEGYRVWAAGILRTACLVASHVSGSGNAEAVERYGENVDVTETRVRIPLMG